MNNSSLSKPVSIIVAIASNYAIGKDNRLLWHIPADLRRFKQITAGHAVVMGRRTYESLPVKPLPGRRNIVISDIPGDFIEGCVMAFSIEEAMEKMDDDKENFIIGGGSIYQQFMPLATKLYITWVHKSFEADTFFPPVNFSEWTEISREDQPFDESLGFSYSYVIYARR